MRAPPQQLTTPTPPATPAKPVRGSGDDLMHRIPDRSSLQTNVPAISGVEYSATFHYNEYNSNLVNCTTVNNYRKYVECWHFSLITRFTIDSSLTVSYQFSKTYEI